MPSLNRSVNPYERKNHVGISLDQLIPCFSDDLQHLASDFAVDNPFQHWRGQHYSPITLITSRLARCPSNSA